MRRGALLATLIWAGCAGGPTDASGSTVTALHELHAPAEPVIVPTLTNDFYALPFPNDVRRRPDGSLDLSRYVRPQEGGLLGQYIDLFDAELRGAGTQAAIYFRFDGAIDPASLPADASASVAADASAFVVDVTPGSPTYGERSPILAHFVADGYDYIGPNWVALLPVPGFPLRERTTYAAVLTSRLRSAGGGRVQRAPDLEAALAAGAEGSADARIAEAARAYRPLTDWLAAQGDLAGELVNATVFTTLDATSLMGRVRRVIYDRVPAPSLAGLTYDGEDQPGVDQLYEGTYQAPNFQVGDPPYDKSGGQLALDDNGDPIVQRMETIRVAMTIPEGAMPEAGWPVVLYAHGTGGDYQSFVRDGSGREAAKVTFADGATAQLAMISIDAVLHGTRSPAGGDRTRLDLAFFNVLNIGAARANVKQGALDNFQLLRLVKAIEVAAAPTTGQPIRFDPSRIYFKGHSQGGICGPLFLAHEPEVQAAVLSGAGGNLVESLLEKTDPISIPQVLAALLRDPIDHFHPLLALAQSFIEDSDAENYARLLFREVPSGRRPLSVFQSLGIVDHATPIPSIEALALGMGVTPVTPMRQPIEHLELAGLGWADPPLAGNVAGGAATGVLLEYPQLGDDDGHFVIFDQPDAIAQSNRFLGSHALSGAARLDPP